ncbi:MAG TPA: hypothetical protein VFA21_07290 [Pyrinomonadaceae bacterium]|jgi:hypothetical protein|nr:hypothetical protein [Pyrinomonadaceae bacterium]
MKKLIVIAAAVALVILVGGAACVLGGYFYHRRQVEAARDEGEKFGKTTDQRGCLQESLRRLREQGRDTFLQRYHRALTHDFTGGCFQTSEETKDFCSGVPRPEEFTAGLNWRVRQCELAGLDDGSCTNVMWDVIKECGKTPLPTVSYPEGRR